MLRHRALLGALVLAAAGTCCVVLYPGGPGQAPVPMVNIKPPPMPLHNTPATVPPMASATPAPPPATPTATPTPSAD